MPSKRTSNPRVKIHKTGIATLSGFNYSDLRSILTAAWLWNDQEMKKRKHNGARGCDCTECAIYRERQLAFLDMAKASMDEAIGATHGPKPPPTKTERFAAVREEIAFRKLLDEMIAKMDAERAARRESAG